MKFLPIKLKPSKCRLVPECESGTAVVVTIAALVVPEVGVGDVGFWVLVVGPGSTVVVFIVVGFTVGFGVVVVVFVVVGVSGEVVGGRVGLWVVILVVGKAVVVDWEIGGGIDHESLLSVNIFISILV